MIEMLPPGAILILGGLFLPFLPNARVRATWGVVVTLLGLGHLWMLPADFSWVIHPYGYEMEIVRLDKLAFVFAAIFHIAAALSMVYSVHLDDRIQHVAGLTYAGSAVAAACAGDLITLFVFWEATAITSVFLIWANRTERAYNTGIRYLMMQVGSGVLLLAGAVTLFEETGQLAFNHIGIETLGGKLILISFGIKACFPFLHNWVQDAYPEATVTGTVWLSAFTTKLAIYALCRGYAGTDILIPIGAAMTVFPIFFAVIENDMRRVLSYSLNNQLGYMVVGVGIGTPLAINGTVSHAFAHIIYKGLLFMSMGAVLHRVGTIKASELGGLYRTMPLTTIFCIIGAMAISAFPLFSGFVTKSMILTAAAQEHHTVVLLILLFASAGVVDHSGIKVPYFAFFAHDSGMRPKEAPWNMLLAMGIAAFFCLAIGMYAAPLYALLPNDMHDLHWTAYDATHVVTQLQLLLGSATAFVFLQKAGLYPAELRSRNIDVEWIYRKAIPSLLTILYEVGGEVQRALQAQIANTVRSGLDTARRLHQPAGLMGEPWPTGATALWAAILLGIYLVGTFV
jgi:multicomponent Na+:H+ antiporter subunit D